MTDVNRINFGPEFGGKRVNANTNKELEEGKVPQQNTETSGNQVQTNFKSADEILEFLNNSSMANKKAETGKKVIQISKYVNPEQAQRISQAVNKCIESLLAFEESAIKEFGLSRPAAQSLAVQSFEEQYMPT